MSDEAVGNQNVFRHTYTPRPVTDMCGDMTQQRGRRAMARKCPKFAAAEDNSEDEALASAEGRWAPDD